MAVRTALPVLVIAAALVVQHPLSAQTSVEVYHGTAGTTGALRLLEGGSPRPLGGREVRLVLPPETEVCLRVVNPHPVFYDYTLDRNVDTARVTLPTIPIAEAFTAGSVGAESLGVTGRDSLAISAIIAFYQGPPPSNQEEEALRANQEEALRAAAMQRVEFDRASATMTTHLARLSKELDEVRRYLAAREAPESYDPGSPGAWTDAYSQARAYVRGGWKSDATQIGHSGLDATINEWASNLAEKAGDDSGRKALVSTLKAYGLSLMNARDALVKPYLETSGEVKRCGTVGEGTTTLNLTATRRGDGTAARMTGEVLEVVVEPTFVRPIVEVVPIAYLVSIRNAPGFEIDDGKIARVEEDDSFEGRLGAMLALQPWSFGKRKEVALGVGIGSNLFTGADTFSEVFASVLVSYRDVFRLGVGWGRADVEGARLGDELSEGDALPEDTQLSDVLETKAFDGFFLVVNVSGFKLPIPGT